MGGPERPVRSCATLLPCGDVMTGRGVDQILLHPSNSQLFEPVVLSARTYVELAEKADGRIARPVSCAYIWANAIDEIECQRPDARMINLESASLRPPTRGRTREFITACSRPTLPGLRRLESTAARWPKITSWTGATAALHRRLRYCSALESRRPAQACPPWSTGAHGSAAHRTCWRDRRRLAAHNTKS